MNSKKLISATVWLAVAFTLSYWLYHDFQSGNCTIENNFCQDRLEEIAEKAEKSVSIIEEELWLTKSGSDLL